MAVQVHDFKRSVRFLDREGIAALHQKCVQPIGSDVDRIILADVFDFDLPIRRQDDRAIGDRMRADGREDDRVQVGGEDGSACSEGVGSRSSGSRNNDPVCDEGIDVDAVDLDRQLDQAVVLGSMEDDIVDRMEGMPLGRSGFQNQALVDRVGAVQQVDEAGKDIGSGDIGHEAEMAEVDAEDRGIDIGEMVGDSEQGSIAPHRDEEVDLLRIDGGEGNGPYFRCFLVFCDDCNAPFFKKFPDAGSQLKGLRFLFVGKERDHLHGRKTPAGAGRQSIRRPSLILA